MVGPRRRTALGEVVRAAGNVRVVGHGDVRSVVRSVVPVDVRAAVTGCHMWHVPSVVHADVRAVGRGGICASVRDVTTARVIRAAVHWDVRADVLANVPVSVRVYAAMRKVRVGDVFSAVRVGVCAVGRGDVRPITDEVPATGAIQTNVRASVIHATMGKVRVGDACAAVQVGVRVVGRGDVCAIVVEVITTSVIGSARGDVCPAVRTGVGIVRPAVPGNTFAVVQDEAGVTASRIVRAMVGRRILGGRSQLERWQRRAKSVIWGLEIGLDRRSRDQVLDRDGSPSHRGVSPRGMS